MRIICTELSSRRSPQVDRPVMKPSSRPMLPPMAKPMPARQPLIARCCHSSPLLSRVQPAASTALGAGRMRLDSQPLIAASCQAPSSRAGRAQGARRRASRWIGGVFIFDLLSLALASRHCAAA
ncbi:hypothetical protein D3C78_1548690 [compost metagenome]